MFCKKCGAQCADGAAFCHICGEAVAVPSAVQTESAETQPVMYQQPMYQQPNYQYGQGADGNTVLEAVKKIASSPIMLVVAITSTIGIVLNLILSMTTVYGSFFESFIDAFSEYGAISSEFEEIIYMIDSLTPLFFISAFISSIPMMLTCVGYWITNITAKGNFSTAGLTIIKVIETIKLVFAYIGAGLSLLMLLLMTVGMSALAESFGSDMPEYVILVMASLLLGVIFGFAFSIFYRTKVHIMVNTVTETAKTGTAKVKGISVFVAVVFILFAVGQLPSAFNVFSPISALLAISNCAYYVCLAIAVFQYRSEMKKLLHMQ